MQRPEECGAPPTVGVIGLGAIGDGVADQRPRRRAPARGVRPARPRPPTGTRTTPRWPRRRPTWPGPADVVVVAVVNDEQVHAVLSGPDGALAAAGPGTTFVVVSTITTECVRAVGDEAPAAGVAVVDCGVSGGPAAAAAGELICMAGGDAGDDRRARARCSTPWAR